MIRMNIIIIEPVLVHGAYEAHLKSMNIMVTVVASQFDN